MASENVNLYHATKFFPQLSFTVYYLYTQKRSLTPVLSIRIVLGSFYLLIFYSANFSTWTWRLPFVLNVTLNPLSPSIHIQILQTDLHIFP